ncbi:hypothetical protein VNO78_26140 [Psophocarpus tetragonolobus]|uniref:Uncharacterized protein n=1 Tax=Psophocarpus tetragonolobus TaxID=3891 RepID=A0AAN9RZ60_PSOTE
MAPMQASHLRISIGFSLFHHFRPKWTSLEFGIPFCRHHYCHHNLCYATTLTVVVTTATIVGFAPAIVVTIVDDGASGGGGDLAKGFAR